MSEKRPPGSNSGKLYENRNNFAPRRYFSNQKEILVYWIADGGVDIMITPSGALNEAWWSIEISEVPEKCHLTTL